MRRPFRFRLLSYNYEPEPTGIGRFNGELCRWLVAHGWDAEAFTGLPHYPWWSVPEAYRDPPREEDLGGVRVVRVRHYVPKGRISGAKRILLDASWLLAIAPRLLADRRRPDLLFAVAPPFLGGLLALTYGRFRRVPVVYHVQDLQVDAAIGMGMLPAWACSIPLAVERAIMRRCRRVTTISETMRRKIAAKDPGRITTALFRNWADVTTMAPWTGPSEYRHEWSCAEDACVVMYSGNLGRKQGIDDLLDAVAQVPETTAVIAGRGAARDEIEARIDAIPHAHLLDLQPAERLAEFLTAGDIHCIPQKRAMGDLVLPSKLLNIMAVGRPLVVAADSGTELARTVLEAGCGVVVPPEDSAAMARAIRTLAADPEQRERMGRSGRRFVTAQLSAPAVIGAFCTMAQQLTRDTASQLRSSDVTS